MTFRLTTSNREGPHQLHAPRNEGEAARSRPYHVGCKARLGSWGRPQRTRHRWQTRMMEERGFSPTVVSRNSGVPRGQILHHLRPTHERALLLSLAGCYCAEHAIARPLTNKRGPRCKQLRLVGCVPKPKHKSTLTCSLGFSWPSAFSSRNRPEWAWWKRSHAQLLQKLETGGHMPHVKIS